VINRDNYKRGDNPERNKNLSGNNAGYTDQAQRDDVRAAESAGEFESQISFKWVQRRDF
jgi:hypothetical protein